MSQESFAQDEYVVVNSVALAVDQVSSPFKIPPLLSTLTGVLGLAALVFLPLCFGAVHPPLYLASRVIAYGLVLAFLLMAPRLVRAILAPDTLSRDVLWFGLAGLAYSSLQIAVFTAQSKEDPILGVTNAWPNWHSSWEAVNSLGFFIASFLLARFWLGDSDRRRRLLVWTVLSAATLMSLIALSHWFYDNGKLFWVFKPDNVFISPRARWPFVNSNHLAHFLLPAFFMLTAYLTKLFSAAKERIAPIPDRQALTAAISSHHLQSRIIRMVLLFTMMLCLLLAIAGSLSRSGWLGLAAGITAFVLGQRYWSTSSRPVSDGAASMEEKAPQTHGPAQESMTNTSIEVGPGTHNTIKHIHHRHHHASPAAAWQVPSLLSKAAKPTFLALALAALYLFLQGRGSELIEERIDYGLAYSKDDMRWQLYSDTWPMLEEHWLIGVGLGQWAKYYPRYMHRSLSGVDPVYLHSDPLQLLAEIGLLGSLVVIVGGLILIRRELKRLKGVSPPERGMILGLAVGLFSLLLASSLDFPFRIPAIVFYCAIYLALLAAYQRRVYNGVP